MGLQDYYCELLILKTRCSVLPSPNHNIRHTVGRAVEPGSIKLNALPCVWFPTLGLRAASRLTATIPISRAVRAPGITIRFSSPGWARAYSAKLLTGTKQRFSGFSHMRQCGEEVLRILVTAGPPIRGGGGIPQRIRRASALRQRCARLEPDNLETRPASARGCRHSG